mmetsp:Transcript_34980/g.51226  ORF Transcript_34980/g.51226 Transcript_34980/m.51226 type:complete len:357 (+) Transcript_34980:49-1119(+)
MTTRARVAMCLALCSATAAFHLGYPALRLSSRHQRLYASAYMLAKDAVDQPLSTVRRSLLQKVAASPLLFGTGLSALAADGKGELVLVVGATGAIGQYAIFDLLERGYKVRGITRRADKIKKQLVGTDLAAVEWVNGDLNDKSTLAPAMVGVKKIIFAAGAHGWEDIENNRRIYAEAVGEFARLGKQEGVNRFVLISSAGLSRIKPNYSDYLKDVLKWKLKGEQMLRASGVPYSIVRAYSLNNEADDAGEDYTVAIFQGDPDGVAALITRKDLGQVAVEAMEGGSTKNTTFEVCNARKNFMGMEPNWRKAMAAVSTDAPLSQQELAAAANAQEKVLTKEDAKASSFYGDPSKGFRN